MKKAMLVTIGVGRTVEQAIYASIKMNNPNFAAFIVSPASKVTLDRTIDGIPLRKMCKHKDFLVNNPEDIDDVFVCAEKALLYLLNEGFDASDIVADITSGTKVMSAALASLAILYRLYSISYVGGTSRGQDGIVIKGAEEPRELKPRRILYKNELATIKKFFSRYQFHACIELLEELTSANTFSVLDKNERDSLQDMQKIIMAFINWERFEHKESLKLFKNVNSYDTTIQQQFLDNLLEDKSIVARKFSSLQGKIPHKYLLIDIFQNAKRRASEGNFDDAVARLYRCLEMIGQYELLLRYGLVSSNVNLESLRGRINEKLFDKLSSKKMNHEIGKLEIGLRENFELISQLNSNDEVAAEYSKHREDFLKYITSRNESIMAHGIRPVAEQDYNKMEALTKSFLVALFSKDADQKLNEIERCFKQDSILNF
jgi:CRISPR-associated protein (TIGR02710 family)